MTQRRSTKMSFMVAMAALLCLVVAHPHAEANDAAAIKSTHDAQTKLMMDMPSDPVDGEMVMSTAYNFHLKNGQRLRFANADTFQQFLADPSVGLGEAKSVHTDLDADATTTTALCPVCGMETAAHGGPQVTMKHGEQVIHTCSLSHAHQVHDQIMDYRDATKDDTASVMAPATSSPQGFCSGPGTTMLNGFSFFQEGGNPCILLWFPGWVLNTPWRYILGCLLIAGSAIFNEYLLHLRRILRKESQWTLSQRPYGSSGSKAEGTTLLRTRSSSMSAPSSGRLATWFRGLSSDTQHVVHSFLHGFSTLLAYMLMLVSMTYDGVLFLCCIVGYVVGYYVFGERRNVVPEGVEHQPLGVSSV
ncbi:hypothetical protein Poli38472_004343 [Pythium oligandrum]|uniref:Copper transport protein n=1 Tax=Pythium oligandrum TaxID=41045 RepID=A0A8K1C9N2_PYTOL|nr:hypothetical protein Poli38472_004343 [Pythium oligandrum]|eukprot:TMW59274.1 hypothetical protein Poli38472_004343 [Pythium oligandrum]